MTTEKYDIVFRLDGKDVSASNVFSRFRRNANSEADLVEKRWRAIGKSASTVGNALSVGITAPVLGIGAASYVAFGRFQDGIGKVGTLIDESTESIGDISKSVLAMGERVPKPLSELTEGLYTVRSASVSAADQMAVLEGSAKLATVGLGTTTEAVDLVTSSMNAFGLKGEEKGRVYDTIFKTIRAGKTTITGLAQGFGGVAPSIAAANIKLDDYLASVAAMTVLGVPAAQAHTQIKAAVSGLTRETKESKKMFNALGAEDFKSLVKNSGGLGQALAKVTNHIGAGNLMSKLGVKNYTQLVKKLGSVEAANEAITQSMEHSDGKVLELLGSTEALNAVLALTGDQADLQADTLAKMRDGVDSVDAKFKQMTKGELQQAQMRKNAIEANAIAIGEKLLPVVGRLADKVVYLVSKFDNLTSGQQDMVIWGMGIAAALGPALSAFGSVVTGAMAAKKAIDAMRAAQAASSAVPFGPQQQLPGGGAVPGKTGKLMGGLQKVAFVGEVVATGALLLEAGKELAKGAYQATGAEDKNLDQAARMRAQIEESKAFSARVAEISAKADAAIAQSKTEVTVDFKNVPAGVVVSSKSDATKFTQNTGRVGSGT